MRAVLIVLDGVGCGALPDAHRYGDEGANSLANTAQAVGGLELPNLAHMGLGNITSIAGVEPATSPSAAHGKMAERSAGKDTTSGHWELVGLVVDQPFPTYPDGFPDEVIGPFEEAIGRGILGNRPASGTEIIEELGPEHLATGKPIVYTSADSVFQIAVHEDVAPVETLYDWCRAARGILRGEHAVGRVIARPFVGEPGAFRRTEHRRDFSVQPHGPTLLDSIVDAGMRVSGIGKIDDIFGGRGVSDCVHTRDNAHGIELLLERMGEAFDGLIFINLIETDSRWGHRNDPEGYARSLEEFDHALPRLLAAAASDLLIVTSDHGVDPTTETTDHSREYVPILAAGPNVNTGSVGTRDSFADVAATVAQWLDLPPVGPGTSILTG
ncbi:MAG: phosphopentomutase [Armatimonadia bacterium]|nr:phosphopentomutase [Armatimonadia bacterium]